MTTQDTPLLLAPNTREKVESFLATNSLTGGWLITGPPHIGKASLAFHLAESILSGSQHLGESDETTKALIANRSHPDLFVLERAVNEKTGKLQADIHVDGVRAVTHGLHQTSTTGHRIVIVDLADHLGRAGANALLKTLEEPPAGTTLFLLSAAPGRLLPTIRSRCRQLALTPVPSLLLKEWCTNWHSDTANLEEMIQQAEGRPGRMVSLLTGEGKAAFELADKYLAALDKGEILDILNAVSAFVGRDADAIWPEARQLILDKLARRLRDDPDQAQGAKLLSALDDVRAMSDRAAALNSDRQHAMVTMANTLHSVQGEKHAHR